MYYPGISLEGLRKATKSFNQDRFETLTAVVMKSYVFWPVRGSLPPGSDGFLNFLLFNPEDGDDIFLRDVSEWHSVTIRNTVLFSATTAADLAEIRSSYFPKKAKLLGETRKVTKFRDRTLKRK
jgi:hypothetical protein